MATHHMRATKYLIDGSIGYGGTFVELRRVAPERWAVIREGLCMNKKGEWEWEPQPSSRDDAFFERCRWATAEEATEAFWKTGNGLDG